MAGKPIMRHFVIVLNHIFLDFRLCAADDYSMMLEKAYFSFLGVSPGPAASALELAGWKRQLCMCASDITQIAGYCCEKCGGRLTSWEPPQREDDFMLTL